MGPAGHQPDPPVSPAASPAPAPDTFRWQALFQRAAEPFFVLDRRRRLLFVNTAWEVLTGLAAAEARGLVCKRRGTTAHDPWDVLVRSACAPPAEVVRGEAGRTRRLVPRAASGPEWWDVDFLPLRGPDRALCFLGRITVATAPRPASPAPLPERLVALRTAVRRRHTLDHLASRVPAMGRLAEQVRLAGQTDGPLLILGEPGVGKEWVARAIHEQSPRRDGPFVCVRCARLPGPALLGLFSGAANLLARAAAGTVLLSEPSLLPRELQATLAGVLASEGEARPRLLAAAGSDPEAEVKAGRFVESLYLALSPLVIRVPSLRERLDDLPELVAQLLPRAKAAAEQPTQGLTVEALDALGTYSWPGNLRELYATLVAACTNANGEWAGPEHLPPGLRRSIGLMATATAEPDQPVNLDQVLEQVERRLIVLALRKARGNRSKAAQWLSVWRPRLLRRMEALGVTEW